ncbi:MAG: T9SS type A sorting domain-containing protein [Flavobacteriales bacterium]|nr:T9SS type A sorting domain-containing protein [Flavobacteriales bacterium]
MHPIYILTITMLFFTNGLVAQLIDQSYFSYGSSGVIHHLYQSIETPDGVIVSGADTTGDAWAPVVVKVSSSGDILWSTAGTYYSAIEGNFEFHLFEFADGYIYGVPEYYLGASQYNREVWKIDPGTGDVIWHFQVPVSLQEMITLDEFDGEQLIMGYFQDQTHCQVAYVNKSTGMITNAASLAASLTELQIVVDDQRNVFFGNGPDVTKFNGSDFNQIIWTTRIYDAVEDDTLENITKFYLDHYDDLYVFSTGLISASFGGNYNLSKINTDNGDLIWNAQVNADENRLLPFIDRYDKMYLSFQHGYVGGGSYFFNCYKVDKGSGQIDWFDYYDITPLGNPSGTSGNGQSALQLDVDCQGDVYLTGYYGDANYGPEQWGTMKASGVTGEKIFDFTTAIDQENYSDLSQGCIMFVKQNQPMMLGQLQDTTDAVNITYVRFDANDGSVLDQHYLNDSAPLASSTMEMLEDGDAMYVFKQIGKIMRVERYDEDGTLWWSLPVTSDAFLKAGGMAQDQSNLYVVASEYPVILTPPYYNPNAQSLVFYKINKTTGLMETTQSIPINFGTVRVLDVESDNGNCYAMYSKSGIIWYCKWDGSNITTPQQHEVAGSNASYPGKLDFLEDSGAEFYYLFGNTAIYRLDKATLNKTVLYSYIDQVHPYDLDLVESTLIIGGQTAIGAHPYLAAIDVVNSTLSWSEEMDISGSIFQIEIADTSVYYVGQMEDQTAIGEYSMMSDSIMWNHQVNNLGSDSNLPLDFSVNLNHRYIAVGGRRNQSSSWSDNMIIMKGLQGENLFEWVETDGYFMQSQAVVTEIMNDSICWIGGAINESNSGKMGFVYTLFAEGPALPDQLDEQDLSSSVFIYPNPSKDFIRLKTEAVVDRIEIYQASGEMVQSLNNVQGSIDVSGLSQGHYTICFTQKGMRNCLPIQIVR